MTIFQTAPKTADQEAGDSKKRTGLVFDAFVQSYQREFNNFWRNPEGFTPQQMAVAWGTDAALLFSNSNATLNYINSIDPNAMTNFDLIVPYNVTINQDGTVTLTEI